eukprot:35787_1
MANVEEKQSNVFPNESTAPFDVIPLTQLYNLHQQYIDLYDVRSEKEYKLHHIRDATHISNATKWNKFHEEYDCPIVIYGNAKLMTNDLCYQLYQVAKSQKKHKWFSVFAGDYIEFYNQYPFLCHSEDNKSNEDEADTVDIVYPAMILPHKLYLGDQIMANHKDVILNLRITHILNISKIGSTLDKEISEKITYLTVQIEDHTSESISTHFDTAHKFIYDALHSNHETKNVVLVHCQMGVSRSASVVISYLMKSHNLSLKRAYLDTKKCRPRIAPNYGFYKELIQFEKQLYGKSTTDALQRILSSNKWKFNYLTGQWDMSA